MSGRYEDEWTFFCLLDIVSGRASAIRQEVPGAAGYGFEFWLRRPGVTEWHQVKFQNSGLGKWTMAALDSEGVFKYFKQKLQASPDASCLFVSAHPAFPLDRVCELAGIASTLAEFKAVFAPTSQEVEKVFKELCETHWAPLAEEETWEWLRRISIRTIDRTLLRQFVEERVRTLISGDAQRALEVLRQIADRALYVELTRDELLAKLDAEGCPRRDWSSVGVSLDEKVRAQATEFVVARKKKLIQGTFLARAEVGTLETLVEARHPPRSIILTGEEGSGKSYVLAQFVQSRLVAGWPVMTLDVTALGDQADADAIGQTLDLPSAPAASLVGVAPDRRSLLVIDAIDSASTLRGHPATLLHAVGDVLQRARAHPDLILVVSCRTSDMSNDERLRDLALGHEAGTTVDVPPLTEGQVLGVLATAGVAPSEITEPQLLLLRNPYNLYLLLEVLDGVVPTFQSREDLNALYLEKVLLD